MNKKYAQLGFGFLRLPHIDPNDECDVDLDAVKEMVDNLRAKYGKDVPIVFPVGYSKPALAYNTALPKIVEKLGGAEANLYICKLSDAATGVPGGDGTHPGVDSTKKMAQELSDFLKTVIK